MGEDENGDEPHQVTPATLCPGANDQAKPTTVNSSTINQSPRSAVSERSESYALRRPRMRHPACHEQGQRRLMHDCSADARY